MFLILGLMNTPTDIVLVSAPQKFNDRIEIEGGKVIYIDTTYKPDHHVSIKGIVEAVPRRLTHNHYWHKGMEMELQEGDEVYFHYLTIDATNLWYAEEKEVYQTEYFNIFAYKRGDGPLTMTANWCLVEPVEQEHKFKSSLDLIVPDAYKKVRNYKVGKLRHIGKPLKHAPTLNVSEGDYVIFGKDADFENEIEGEVFYTMQQEELLATLPEECILSLS